MKKANESPQEKRQKKARKRNEIRLQRIDSISSIG